LKLYVHVEIIGLPNRGSTIIPQQHCDSSQACSQHGSPCEHPTHKTGIVVITRGIDLLHVCMSYNGAMILSHIIFTQTNKPVWQSTMRPGEREAEKAGLSKLHRKANYLKSSRYSKTKWSNTASSGPVKIKQIKSSKL